MKQYLKHLCCNIFTLLACFIFSSGLNAQQCAENFSFINLNQYVESEYGPDILSVWACKETGDTKVEQKVYFNIRNLTASTVYITFNIITYTDGGTEEKLREESLFKVLQPLSEISGFGGLVDDDLWIKLTKIHSSKEDKVADITLDLFSVAKLVNGKEVPVPSKTQAALQETKPVSQTAASSQPAIQPVTEPVKSTAVKQEEKPAVVELPMTEKAPATAEAQPAGMEYKPVEAEAKVNETKTAEAVIPDKPSEKAEAGDKSKSDKAAREAEKKAARERDQLEKDAKNQQEKELQAQKAEEQRLNKEKEKQAAAQKAEEQRLNKEKEKQAATQKAEEQRLSKEKEKQAVAQRAEEAKAKRAREKADKKGGSKKNAEQNAEATVTKSMNDTVAVPMVVESNDQQPDTLASKNVNEAPDEAAISQQQPDPAKEIPAAIVNTGNVTSPEKTTKNIIDDGPGKEDVERAKVQVVEKIKQLEINFSALSKKDLPTITWQNTVNNTVKMFVDEEQRIQISSLTRQTITAFKIRTYCQRLRTVLSYDSAMVENANVYFVSGFKKNANGQWEALTAFTQRFTGFRDNKPVYTDITEKTIRVILDYKPMFVDGVQKGNWELLLGDIKVLSTKSL